MFIYGMQSAKNLAKFGAFAILVNESLQAEKFVRMQLASDFGNLKYKGRNNLGSDLVVTGNFQSNSLC